MHCIFDLHCSPDKKFIGVELDRSIRTTEAKELIESTLLDRDIGRIFPTQKGFLYYPPDKQWDEDRMVGRLHDLFKELFDKDCTVAFARDNKRIMREADGSEHVVAASA